MAEGRECVGGSYVVCVLEKMSYSVVMWLLEEHVHWRWKFGDFDRYTVHSSIVPDCD